MYTESNIRVDQSVSVNLESYCDIYAENTVEQFCWGTYAELKTQQSICSCSETSLYIDINEK